MSITESLTKIRMSSLKKARDKFGYSSVWAAERKIMYKDEEDTKAKVSLIDIVVANSNCVTEKQELFFVLMALFYFHLLGGFFTQYFKTVSYFVFLVLFIGMLPLTKII